MSVYDLGDIEYMNTMNKEKVKDINPGNTLKVFSISVDDETYNYCSRITYCLHNQKNGKVFSLYLDIDECRDIVRDEINSVLNKKGKTDMRKKEEEFTIDCPEFELSLDNNLCAKILCESTGGKSFYIILNDSMMISMIQDYIEKYLLNMNLN